MEPNFHFDHNSSHKFVVPDQSNFAHPSFKPGRVFEPATLFWPKLLAFTGKQIAATMEPMVTYIHVAERIRHRYLNVITAVSLA